MASAKQKRLNKINSIALALALFYCTPSYTAGVPEVSYPNIPAGVIENLQLVAQKAGRWALYTRDMYIEYTNYVNSLSVNVNLTQMDIKKKLANTETLQNLKLKEQTEPVQDICKIIVSNENESNKAEKKKEMAKQSDLIIAASNFASQDSSAKTFGENKNSDKDFNETAKHQKKMINKMSAFSEANPYIFKKYENENERHEEYAKNASIPKPYEGDYIMNPNAYLVYTEAQKRNVQNMVNNYIATPYVNLSPMDPDFSPEQTMSDMSNTLVNVIANSLMTDAYYPRVEINGTSELYRMKKADDFYYNGTDSVQDSIYFRAGNDTDDMTETVLERHDIIMAAREIDQQLKEYERDLAIELSEAIKLLKNTEKLKVW